MTDLVKEFEDMVIAVRDATVKFEPNNTEKLKLYAFYKQATTGDVEGECPSIVHMVERAKWSAWNAIKGWDKPKAMQAYIDLIKSKI